MAEPLSAYGIGVYQADDGNSYNIKMMLSIINGQGGTATTPGSHPPLPKYIKPRRWHGSTTDGNKVSVVWLDPTQGSWQNPVGANYTGNNSVQYIGSGRTGEKLSHSI